MSDSRPASAKRLKGLAGGAVVVCHALGGFWEDCARNANGGRLGVAALLAGLGPGVRSDGPGRSPGRRVELDRRGHPTRLQVPRERRHGEGRDDHVPGHDRGPSTHEFNVDQTTLPDASLPLRPEQADIALYEAKDRGRNQVVGLLSGVVTLDQPAARPLVPRR